jgi:hypothetical protein
MTSTVTEAEVSIVMSIRVDGKTLMEALDGNASGLSELGGRTL